MNSKFLKQNGILMLSILVMSLSACDGQGPSPSITAQDDPVISTATTEPTAAEFRQQRRAQANKKKVQQLYTNFLAGNIQAVLDAQAPDAKWSFEWSSIPSVQQEFPWVGKTYENIAGIQQFFQDYFSVVQYTSYVPDYFVAEDDKVFVHVNVTAKSLQTKNVFSFQKIELWQFDDQNRVALHRCWLDTRALDATLR